MTCHINETSLFDNHITGESMHHADCVINCALLQYYNLQLLNCNQLMSVLTLMLYQSLDIHVGSCTIVDTCWSMHQSLDTLDHALESGHVGVCTRVYTLLCAVECRWFHCNIKSLNCLHQLCEHIVGACTFLSKNVGYWCIYFLG